MDLFNTLGSAIIGDIDAARERADARDIHELHEPLFEPEPREYGVTVELTLTACNEKEAALLAQSLLERANRLSKVIYDIERVVEL
jgi:hypothetical protein